jgi:hypothetical protein
MPPAGLDRLTEFASHRYCQGALVSYGGSVGSCAEPPYDKSLFGIILHSDIAARLTWANYRVHY